jgi:hypothetical protein
MRLGTPASRPEGLGHAGIRITYRPSSWVWPSPSPEDLRLPPNLSATGLAFERIFESKAWRDRFVGGPCPSRMNPSAIVSRPPGWSGIRQFLGEFWFLHNIHASANVYKRGTAARGAVATRCCGEGTGLRQAPLSDCEPQRALRPRHVLRNLRGRERQEVAVSNKAKRRNRPSVAGSPLYKQTQLAATQHEGQVPDGQRVMVNCTGKGLRQNKANWAGRFGPWRAECAKQTQLPEAGHRRGVREPAGARVGWTNKANSLRANGDGRWLAGPDVVHRRGQSRQTNPISPDKAGPGDKGCCTNKPNSCRHADPEIGVPGRVDCAKQSQFGPAPSCNRVQWRQTNPIQPGRRAGRVPGRAKCAKRTQSPPDRPVRWGWNRPLALGYSPCYVTQPGLGTQTAPLGWWKWHHLVK